MTDFGEYFHISSYSVSSAAASDDHVIHYNNDHVTQFVACPTAEDTLSPYSLVTQTSANFDYPPPTQLTQWPDCDYGDISTIRQQHVTTPVVARDDDNDVTGYPKSCTAMTSQTIGGRGCRRLAVRFTDQQIDCVCDVLFRSRDTNKLELLLGQLAEQDLLRNSEQLCKARALVAYGRGDYDQVYRLLSCRQYSPTSFTDLQQLWYAAHYSEAQLLRGSGRPLRPVDKYRVRRKNPLPPTIWDGEETVYCFKTRWRRELKATYAVSRYPTTSVKLELSARTGLTMTQISNWFKNKRQRERVPYEQETHPSPAEVDVHRDTHITQLPLTDHDNLGAGTTVELGQEPESKFVHFSELDASCADSVERANATQFGGILEMIDREPKSCSHDNGQELANRKINYDTDYRHLRMALGVQHPA